MKQNQTQNVIINLSELKKKKRRRRKKNIKKTGTSSLLESQARFIPQYVPKYPSTDQFKEFEQRPYSSSSLNLSNIAQMRNQYLQNNNLQNNRNESINTDVNDNLKEKPGGWSKNTMRETSLMNAMNYTKKGQDLFDKWF